MHCPIGFDLRAFFLCLAGVNWVMPVSVKSMMKSCSGVLGSHRYAIVWGATPPSLIWCIWGERNHCTFEDKESTLPNLKFLFLKTIYEWGLKFLETLYIITDGISRLCFCAVKNMACYLYNNKTKNKKHCSLF